MQHSSHAFVAPGLPAIELGLGIDLLTPSAAEGVEVSEEAVSLQAAPGAIDRSDSRRTRLYMTKLGGVLFGLTSLSATAGEGP